MAEKVRCLCTRCTIAGLRWPVILILLGILIFVDRWNLRYGFEELFPLLLIVFGGMKVAEALAPAGGHVTG
jgi:hypothetical protein